MGPYAIAANALEQIINLAFADEGTVAEHDKLHEALGVKRRRCGISPLRETPNPRNSKPGSAPIIHHPDVQAHADDDARLHRRLPRDGASSPPRRSTPRITIPMPRCASRTRPSTSSWCRW